MYLAGKTVLVTGGAARLGKTIALAAAQAGAEVIIHYNTSADAARETQAEIQAAGGQAHLLQADLTDLESLPELIDRALEFGPLYALVNNASIFEDIDLKHTNLAAWQRHIDINLTAPFVLSKGFAQALGGSEGRIINLLDWRAFRPGTDHFPYSVSKAGLAALTRSLAVALAPAITVNGIALGAILPPSDGGDTAHILANVPAGRWAHLDELAQTVLFLLGGPAYLTGEILHLDGGRHLI